ncbi:hypothetical protein GCM10027589_46410 [Actinocorallia lasiicapitis]
MDGSSGYDESMPQVEEHVEKYQRALARVRATHRGRPVEDVRDALSAAFREEGVDVWAEVADDAARLIANEE